MKRLPTQQLIRKKVEKAARIIPCGKCGHNMWRTVRKDTEWSCRRCGYVRNDVVTS